MMVAKNDRKLNNDNIADCVTQDDCQVVSKDSGVDTQCSRTHEIEDAKCDVDVLISAPDGGYGWVVVLAAFLHSFFIDGIANSFGLFLPVLCNYFGSSVALISLIGASLVGCYQFIGPFISGLVNAFGCRKVVITGAIISCIGFWLSAQSESVALFLLTYGILAGVGFGMIYLPSIICLSFYFEKRRAVATGLAVAGTGVGTFVMPVVISKLLYTFGWRCTLQCLALLSLSCLLYGLFYLPLESVGSKGKELTDEVAAVTEKLQSANPVVLKKKECGSRSSFRKVQSAGFFSVTPSRSIVPEEHSLRSRATGSPLLNPEQWELISKGFSIKYKIPTSHVSQSSNDIHSSSSTNRVNGLERFSGLFSRSDVFYAGSINNLPKITNEGRTVESCRSSLVPVSDNASIKVLRQSSNADGSYFCSRDTLRSGRESVAPDCISFYVRLLLSLRGALGTLDFSLITEPVMVILLLSNLFAMQAFYIPFMFIRNFGIGKRLTVEVAELLLPLIGLSNTLGRVVFGWVADRRWVSSVTLHSGSLCICGILCALCPSVSSINLLSAYAIAFGFIIGPAFSCLPSIILTELLGINRLTNSFGLLLVSRGIASIFGSPVGGYIYDITGSYDATFYFAAILFVISGLLPCLLPLFPIVNESKSRTGAKRQISFI